MKLLTKMATTTLVLLGTAAAHAADLPARPVYKAAAVPAAYNWTGLYIGVMGGYAFGTGNTNGFNGGVAGGTIGYNYQAPGSIAVFGVELDGGWTNFGDSESATIGGVTVTAQSKAEALATLRARLGAAFDRTLVYVTGGGAWMRNQISLSVAAPGIAVGVSDTQNHVGWVVGAGVEQAFGGNWSGKIEYNYLGLQSKTYFSAFDSGDQNVHLIKAGLNYHF